MPSNDPLRRFQDILDNIARIQQYTAGMNCDAFMADPKTYDAVERCLSRISEAAIKLAEEAHHHCPDIPWPSIRGLGNFLRHEYDRIEGDRIWFMLEDRLPELKAAVQAAVTRLETPQPPQP